MGQNCTSVPARVAACLSRLCHTNMLDCSYIHGLRNQRLSQSSCWKDLKSTKYKMYPKCFPLEWFVFSLSKNVSLRPLHKHSVTANRKLLVITISVISMSFPPAYTLFSDSLSQLHLISHQEECLERLQVSGCHNFGMKFSWEWSLTPNQLQGLDKVRPVPL